jgi:BirA family biotin operon repressor/biotin-[acetyl-CoA-carboxylase] ligase
LNLPDEFAEPVARAAGRLGAFRRIQWYPEVTSTNDVASVLAEHGGPEGTVVVANAQSAGRGRHGRVWFSPAGAGLYVSAILRPSARSVPPVTIAAGVAVAEGILEATGLASRLKWPNDVYVEERKVAGILAEAGSTTVGLQYIVLGFGINLMPAAYPAEVAARATSLEEELGRPVDRGLLLAACLACLAARYEDLQRSRAAAVLEAWRSRARPLVGRSVEWTTGESLSRGVAEDIDETGALLVRTPAGLTRIISGDVRWT